MYRTIAKLGIVVFAAVTAAALLVRMWDSHTAPAIVIQPIPYDATMVVAITGEVATPGAYSLPGGSRGRDLVAAAGGYTDVADREAFNPAAPLLDGEQVVILAVASEIQTPASKGDPEFTDINSATLEQLVNLPGIGESIATAIIMDRSVNGAFSSVDDLARVPGVSDKLVDELRQYLTVGP